MIITRTNKGLESIEHLAGPRCEPKVHLYFPLFYWVVESDTASVPLHEAMGIMLADCFQFQVDYITGDANMAAYRTAVQDKNP